jgi:hypothetical protein
MQSVSPSFQHLNTWINIYLNLYSRCVTWCSPNGVLHKSLPSVCVYPPAIFTRQQLNKRVPAPATYCWMRRFLCGPCSIKGKWTISYCYHYVVAYHLIITCSVSWPIRWLLLFQTFLLCLSSRVLHVCCTFILSHRAQCWGTTESRCMFHPIWITLASKMQLSTAVCYSSPNPSSRKGTRPYFI